MPRPRAGLFVLKPYILSMKWEYFIVEIQRETEALLPWGEAQKQINEAGDDGWEAIGVWYDEIGTSVIFKRPIPS
jgi:hypothetical protein